MAAEQLPTPHIRWVFAGLMFRAGLMSRAEFEAEHILIFGPSFGPAIAERIDERPSASGPLRRRRHGSVPRRI